MAKRERIFKGDTAPIEANLFDEDGVSPITTTDVSWQIRKPDGTIVTGGPDAIATSEATIAFSDTDQAGSYSTQVTFTLPNGDKRSTVLDFEVVDPLETTTESTNPVDATVDYAWMLLEDLFDSELGGPYLRDRTKQQFDRNKMARLMPGALYNINNFYQPATGFDTTTFPFDQHMPLLAQGLLVASIRHLMRAYVEQPLPSGPGAPSYFDRRDYLNRWQLILQQEETQFNQWLDLFKRGQMDLAASSILVGGYASYPTRYPRYMRGRYPYIYRF